MHRWIGRAALAAAIALATAARGGPAADLRLRPLSFADLPGWAEDRLEAALPAIRASCAALADRRPTVPATPAPLFGSRAPWLTACAQLEALSPDPDGTALRAALEAAYRPYRVVDRRAGEDGLVTGYFEPELTGSLARRSPSQVPLYRTPERRALRRQSRAAIAAGGLAGRGLELVWIDDPIDAFFLEIQGSGRIRLAEGGTRRLRYTRFNGHPYVAIGTTLLRWGEMTRDEISMQSIIAWLRAHPQRAQELMNTNPSYVYFDWIAEDAPQGSQGTDLTAGRSLAIDPRAIPYGAPLWLETTHPETGQPFRRLTVAQDKGGAIKGVVRADLFWGTGAEAGAAAGRMAESGSYAVLLPRGLDLPAALLAAGAAR